MYRGASSCPWDWHSLFDGLLAVFHQQPDGRGCCVELGHLVLVNDAPHSPNIRVGGDTFVLSRRQSSDTAVPHCSPPAAPAQAGGAEQQLDPSTSLQGNHTRTPAQLKDPSLPPWDGFSISPPQVSQQMSPDTPLQHGHLGGHHSDSVPPAQMTLPTWQRARGPSTVTESQPKVPRTP